MGAHAVITHALNQGVTLAKASDRALAVWERELSHRADVGLHVRLTMAPIGVVPQLGRNDLRALSCAFRVLAMGVGR